MKQSFVISLCIYASLLLTGCSAPKQIAPNATPLPPQEDNNLIHVETENVRTNASDKIIFEGSNNIFEIIAENSDFFDGQQDVIIIRGSNNVITLVSKNCIDLSKVKADTLVMVGNKQRYAVDFFNRITLNTQRPVKTKEVMIMDQPAIVPNVTKVKFLYDKPVKFSFFDSRVSPQTAHTYFSERLSSGDPQYFFELAEMHLYGVGIEESVPEAISLYQQAAAKNHVPSLVKLGDLYAGNFNVEENRDRAVYYYKRCALLGESYCDRRLEQ